MGLLQAISGLNAANTAMDIISDNISNASTIGFKSKSIVFADLTSRRNQTNKTEGMGVDILKKKSNVDTGEIFFTNRNLDLNINKNGFFRLLAENGSVYYTRNGHFYIDKKHHIVNSAGMSLTGYSIDNYYLKFGNNYSNLRPIDLSNHTKITGQPTTILKLFVTLNPHDKIKIKKEFNTQISTTYNHKLKTRIIDSFGKKRFINFYFVKTANKIWDIYPLEQNKNKKITPFKIEFDNNGNIISDKILKMDIKLNNNGKEEKILLNLETTLQKKVTDKKNYFSHNGYTKGIIQNYKIENNGMIYGIYSNQKKIPLSNIVLSNFTNAENLKSEGNGIFSKNEMSGIETTGTPSSLGFGQITCGGLEKSNVDLNKEFINMIIAQRNYQSNVQVIKVEEKMFNILMNLL
ncbi:flagellar hook protein FlgE [Buchnera aphidicola]|uniref:flagellar hook protein FlgE n=1 Tax=Buchnera aphidicola TaxID=9 RepID=UPI003464B54E